MINIDKKFTFSQFHIFFLHDTCKNKIHKNRLWSGYMTNELSKQRHYVVPERGTI